MEDQQTKKCSKCKVVKPIGEFRFHRPNANKGRTKPCLRSTCRKCDDATTRDWQRKNAGRFKQYNWLRYSGIKFTIEEYAQLLLKQKGVCAICGKPETQIIGGTLKSLSVDHNHDTGKVRGLLCVKCNLLISHAEEEPAKLISAIQYLEYWKNNNQTQQK